MALINVDDGLLNSFFGSNSPLSTLFNGNGNMGNNNQPVQSPAQQPAPDFSTLGTAPPPAPAPATQPDGAYPPTGSPTVDWLNKHILQPFVPHQAPQQAPAAPSTPVAGVNTPKPMSTQDQPVPAAAGEAPPAAAAPTPADATNTPPGIETKFSDLAALPLPASSPTMPQLVDYKGNPVQGVAPGQLFTDGNGNPITTHTPYNPRNYGKAGEPGSQQTAGNAPIPGRPVVPMTRDINPATGQPFNTQDWNDFKHNMINPETGETMTAQEQQAYARNNNIDLNSFGNNHHTMQQLLGYGSELVRQVNDRYAAAPQGRFGRGNEAAAQDLQNDNFLGTQAADQQAARQYDVNKPALQQQANMTALAARMAAQKSQAQSEAEIATANQKNAQTAAFAQFNLSNARNPQTGEPLMGQDLLNYIKQNNPGMAADLQAYRNGDKNPSDLSTRPGMQNPQSRQAFSQVARSIWPDFSENQFAVRQGVQKSFASGEDASTIQSLNTAVQHIKMFNDLAAAQKNGDIQTVNRIQNFVQTQLGHPEATNAATTATALSGELANIFKKSGATDQEIAGIQGNLDPSKMSPQQIDGWTKTAEGLMAGRLNGVNNKWQNQYVQDDPRRSEVYPGLLSPSSQQALASLPGGQAILQEATGKSAAPQGGGGATAPQPIYASAPGKPRLVSVDGGKTWKPAQ